MPYIEVFEDSFEMIPVRGLENTRIRSISDGLTIPVDQSMSPYTSTRTSGNKVFLCDATAGNIIINLPSAVGNSAVFTFKKIDSSANTVTIVPSESQTIDDDADKEILFENTTFSIASDNVNWIMTS